MTQDNIRLNKQIIDEQIDSRLFWW